MVALDPGLACVATVPDDPMRDAWPTRLEHSRRRNRSASGPDAPIGPAWLRVSDIGETPHPGWHRGSWRPSVRLARLTVTEDGSGDDDTSTEHVDVDMEIVRALRPGDVVHLRAPCGGLAISALRDGRLLYSAGAITSVPSGNDLVVGIPGEVEKVEALFREIDGEFELPELPVEIVFESRRYIYCRCNRKVGPYRFFMINGFRPGIPGESAFGAISREGVSPETAVISTAQLFEASSGNAG
jgi:hypothetical protein